MPFVQLRTQAKEPNHGLELLVRSLTFLSTAFMQEELIPGWVATVAEYNPVNWTVVAGREAAQAGTDWGSVVGYCGLLAAFAVACTMLATRAFRAYQSSL
jgi:ABC-2 type transport system permease protein